MKTSKQIFEKYNERLKAGLIPNENEIIDGFKNEIIEGFKIDPNDPIFETRLIDKLQFDLEFEEIKNNLNK
jgi:hypothetical protein